MMFDAFTKIALTSNQFLEMLIFWEAQHNTLHFQWGPSLDLVLVDDDVGLSIIFLLASNYTVTKRDSQKNEIHTDCMSMAFVHVGEIVDALEASWDFLQCEHASVFWVSQIF